VIVDRSQAPTTPLDAGKTLEAGTLMKEDGKLVLYQEGMTGYRFLELDLTPTQRAKLDKKVPNKTVTYVGTTLTGTVENGSKLKVSKVELGKRVKQDPGSSWNDNFRMDNIRAIRAAVDQYVDSRGGYEQEGPGG